MSTIPPTPAFKPFNLALIQLGQIGSDKGANLKHARDMIRRAANGEGAGNAQGGKPDLIVLPVRARFCLFSLASLRSKAVVLKSVFFIIDDRAGMLQFALWPRVFPVLRRADRVQTRREV